MHKVISIENEGLHFLHQILSSSPARSTAESRKQNLAFTAIRPHLEAYKKDLKAVEDQFRVYTVVKDAQNNDQEGWKIPREKKAEHETAVRAVDEKKATVTFEIESFTILKSAFDGLFEREEAKEKGIAGEDQTRWIDQIDRAFEGTKDA